MCSRLKICAVRFNKEKGRGLSSASFSGTNDRANELESRPFEDIPGPKPLPVIGTLYKYLPLIGEYSFTRLHETGMKKLERYGPLVREEMVPGVPVVWVFRPEDVAEVFKAEAGLHPERRSHLALLKYRKDRSNVYNTGGLLPTNGTEWWRLRKEFQKVLSKPRNVVEFLEETDLVVKEFVELCSKEKFHDLLPLLSRLFLERNDGILLYKTTHIKTNTLLTRLWRKRLQTLSQFHLDSLTCLVTFDERMNSLSAEERMADSRTSKLINAAFTTNSAILRLDNGPRLWRFLETPLYRKLRKVQNYMEEVALEMVSENKKNNGSDRSRSLVKTYLENPALDVKDIVGMACDMLLAGIDTTTYSTAFALYHLAKNENAQEKLRAEATQLLKDSNEPITPDILRNASYTKAVIKETFRLNPISVGVGRILQTDTVLSGYHVPKGAVIVTQNQIICRLPEYFTEPDSFIPERWLRESTENDDKIGNGKSVHPYLLLPFGHGPRSCIARRFAEQNMQTLLLRTCRQLKFVWRGEQLGSMSFLINKPDAPIKVQFSKNSGE